jgi:hypothetical protein
VPEADSVSRRERDINRTETIVQSWGGEDQHGSGIVRARQGLAGGTLRALPVPTDHLNLSMARNDDAFMSSPVLTVVSAAVGDDRHERLVDGFRELLKGPVPDGLLRTELLRGAEGRWRIQSLWRDREALETMRSRSEAPAAPTLFRSIGSEPSLEIWEVVTHSGT